MKIMCTYFGLVSISYLFEFYNFLYETKDRGEQKVVVVFVRYL